MSTTQMTLCAVIGTYLLMPAKFTGGAPCGLLGEDRPYFSIVKGIFSSFVVNEILSGEIV